MLTAIFFTLMLLALLWMVIRTVYRFLVFLILSAPLIAVIVAFALGHHFA